MSNKARGKSPRQPASAEVLHLWDGISVSETKVQASVLGRALPSVGQFVARLELPDNAPVTWEKTRGPGHYTLWGAPSVLLSYVTTVTPIDATAR